MQHGEGQHEATEQGAAAETWLTVGEVARHAGLSVRTLHHYDQRGLLVRVLPEWVRVRTVI